MSDPLADAIQAALADLPQLKGKPAVVSSTSPLEVTLSGGTTISASRNANYTPVVSDTVYVLQADQDSAFIVCKIASGS